MKQHPKMPEQTDPSGNYITTYSGIKFYLDKLNVADVPIEDIAHSLAMKCRFNGHISRFYSVAEHSVYVSRACAPADALWGLLHDASEAFVPDMPRPIKPYIVGFKELEHRIMGKVAEHYGLHAVEPPSVALADKHIVANEAIALFHGIPGWVYGYDPSVCVPYMPLSRDMGLPPEMASQLFLDRFKELTDNANNKQKN